jgi:hypothetical protein
VFAACYRWLQQSGPAHGIEAKLNVTVTNYNYGTAPNVANYTWQYNSASAYDNVPFEVLSNFNVERVHNIANDNSTLLHNATGPAQWVPVSNLTRTNADVTIVFIAPNSIKFRKQVKDPIFQVTYPDTELSNTGALHGLNSGLPGQRDRLYRKILYLQP